MPLSVEVNYCQSCGTGETYLSDNSGGVSEIVCYIIVMHPHPQSYGVHWACLGHNSGEFSTLNTIFQQLEI